MKATFKKYLPLGLFMATPIALTALAWEVGVVIGTSNGILTEPECSLPWPYIAFSYVPSLLAVLLVLVGVGWFAWRKQFKLLLIQLVVTAVCLLFGLIINFVLTTCM